jgi:hypothetical protein
LAELPVHNNARQCPASESLGAQKRIGPGYRVTRQGPHGIGMMVDVHAGAVTPINVA